MRVTLSDEARQYMALFEDETGVAPKDCLIDDEYDRLVFLIPAGEMGEAIGPGGSTVQQVQEAVGRDIQLVEDADTPEAFVANVLAPAAVYGVTISENDTTIAYADVDSQDTGAAIGKDGRNIEAARRLARRHYDIDDIELT